MRPCGRRRSRPRMASTRKCFEIPSQNMTAIIKRLSGSLQRDGVLGTALKCARYPFKPILRRRSKKRWADALGMTGVEDRFLAIYQKNLWENLESASGIGSTFWYT